jgi:hypothetical protein
VICSSVCGTDPSIDLLRRGQEHSDAGGVVVAPPGELLTRPRFDDLACVSRAGDRAQVEVYAVTPSSVSPALPFPCASRVPTSCWTCPHSSSNILASSGK